MTRQLECDLSRIARPGLNIWCVTQSHEEVLNKKEVDHKSLPSLQHSQIFLNLHSFSFFLLKIGTGVEE